MYWKALSRFIGLSVLLVWQPLALAKTKSCTELLRPLSLPEVFALPMDEVENCLAEKLADMCAFEITPGESSSSPLVNSVEMCAIHAYTTVTFVEINRGLWKSDARGSGLKGEDWAYVRLLDHALNKIKSEKPLTVYRGTTRKGLKFTKKGQIIRLKGYTSTSPNQEVAKWFLSGSKDGDRLMIINALSAKNISPMAGAPEEEYLLPRSTWVRFEKSEIKEITVWPEGAEKEEKRQVEFIYLTEVAAPK